MEVLVLCLGGLLLGFLLTYLGQQVIQFLYPAQPLLIPPNWVLLTVMYVTASGIIGALYPSLKSASSDPVEALSYQ